MQSSLTFEKLLEAFEKLPKLENIKGFAMSEDTLKKLIKENNIEIRVDGNYFNGVRIFLANFLELDQIIKIPYETDKYSFQKEFILKDENHLWKH